jgi:hypothetical protein
MTDVSPRRLPIEVVVRRSFLYAWESRATLAVPYTIYTTITVLADLLLSYAVKPANQVPLYFLTAAEQVFAMAFAVGVHRFVLMGEARPGFQFFRWDRHFVQYVLLTLLLFILGIMAALMVVGALGTDSPEGGGAGGAAGLFGLAVMLVVALMLSRLALTLPSAALGDQKRPREIWQATEGNSFRLLATALITALPFLVIEAALIRLMPESGGGPTASLVTLALGLISPIQLIVVTIMLSLSYDVLVRGGGPPAA